MQEKLERLLSFLTSKGARYADVRYEEHTRQELFVENGVLKSFTHSVDVGTGIRVLYENGWGFAATDERGDAALERTALKALEIAMASNKRSNKEVQLSLEPAHKAAFKSWVMKDPFLISDDEKIDLLKAATLKMKENSRVVRATGSMSFRRIDKLFFEHGRFRDKPRNLHHGCWYRG